MKASMQMATRASLFYLSLNYLFLSSKILMILRNFLVKVAILVAEIISCLKRSLARMLVIVVSLGFGIIKYGASKF
jgi:hypothetical protein